MKTGYIARDSSLPGCVVISRAPRRLNLPSCKLLYPGTYQDEVERSLFVDLYNELCLARLNPARVWEDLHDLAMGHEPVLVAPRRDVNRCHRRLVAQWLESSLSVTVDEIGSVQLSLFSA